MSAIEEHRDNNDGYCTRRKAWTADGCEPDTVRRARDVCGERTVYGTQECVVMNLPRIDEGMEDEDAPPK